MRPLDATGTRRPPAYPAEPADPCCLPALGELGGVPPREGLAPSYGAAARRRHGGPLTYPAEDSPSGLWRSLGKRVGLTALAGSNPASSATLQAHPQSPRPPGPGGGRTHGAAVAGRGQRGAIPGGLLKLIPLFTMVLPGAMAIIILPDPSNPDKVFLTLVTTVLPVGITGLVLAGLIAAIMSSVDSTLNGRDLGARAGPRNRSWPIHPHPDGDLAAALHHQCRHHGRYQHGDIRRRPPAYGGSRSRDGRPDDLGARHRSGGAPRGGQRTRRQGAW